MIAVKDLDMELGVATNALVSMMEDDTHLMIKYIGYASKKEVVSIIGKPRWLTASAKPRKITFVRAKHSDVTYRLLPYHALGEVARLNNGNIDRRTKAS